MLGLRGVLRRKVVFGFGGRVLLARGFGEKAGGRSDLDDVTFAPSDGKLEGDAHRPDPRLDPLIAMQSEVFNLRASMEEELGRGDLEGALSSGKRMVAVVREMGSEGLLAGALLHLSQVYVQRGEFESALGVLEESLGLLEAGGGGERGGLAMGSVLAALGLVHKQRAELMEESGEGTGVVSGEGSVALHYLRRARKVREEVHGAEEGGVGEAVVALNDSMEATVIRLVEGPNAALPLATTAHDTLLSTLGSHHSATATAANNLGVILRQNNRPSEAIPLYRAALEARKGILGENHRDTIATTFNLARALREVGETKEADTLMQRVKQQASTATTPEPERAE